MTNDGVSLTEDQQSSHPVVMEKEKNPVAMDASPAGCGTVAMEVESDTVAVTTSPDSYALPGNSASVPLKALGHSTRYMMSRDLDPDATTLSESGYLKDYRGLAELMEFDARDITTFQNKDKTLSLLQEYEQKGAEATIGQLWDFLHELERFDVLTNPTLISKIEKDVMTYKKRQEVLLKSETCGGPARPLQPPPTLRHFLPESMDLHDHMDRTANEFHDITVGEVEGGAPEMFDAFLSYCDKDIHFVKEMIHMLEEVYQLKLCVNARDLIIGTSKYTVTAKIIAERCRKVLIIMSNNFLMEPECDFQVKFAHALSPGSRCKKMIPIMVEPCEIPLILKHVTVVDHTKVDLIEWFYRRLSSSLRASSHSDTGFEFDEEDDTTCMAELDFDFEHDLTWRDEMKEEDQPDRMSSASTVQIRTPAETSFAETSLLATPRQGKSAATSKKAKGEGEKKGDAKKEKKSDDPPLPPLPPIPVEHPKKKGFFTFLRRSGDSSNV